jgi:ornithine carbamoyltransferase
MSVSMAETLPKELKGRNFLTLADFTKEQLQQILHNAMSLKKQHKEGIRNESLCGKTLAMIFEKPSTRTRTSFEVGMVQLGGHGMYLNSKDLQLGRGETIADTAKVLSQYVDGIMLRTYSHHTVEEMAAHASVPVINGLTDMYHPCQTLADFLTIFELKGKLTSQKVVYVGDGNNVAHSFLIGAAIMGMDFTVVCPPQLSPKDIVVEKAMMLAKENGAHISIEHDVKKAVTDADIIYADVWTSMGDETGEITQKKLLQPYQVNEELWASVKEDCSFMHCLPAHRGEEVTSTIIDGPHSVVFQQAGNRLHAQKALLLALM